ncbi:MAG: glycosyltransferase [Lachnospiraceae bacterium]|nr:glycosyltransferase [Lachnospiraceae bacterium]
MISIIVPVYNAAAYLTETIENVTRQTYRDWELLLVNDCSKDQSETVIRQYLENHPDPRIHLINLPENGGAAKARNRGLMAAKGRYIAFLDADDIWAPEKLEKELAFLKEKNAGFVFTAYEFGDANGVGTGKVVQVPETLVYQQALSRTIIFTTTVLLDTEKISKDLIQMPIIKSEDTATWWQILKAGYVAYGLNETLAVYRRPAKSLSSNKLEAIRRIWHLYREIGELSVVSSAWYLIQWAVRATLRRV